MDGVPEGLAIGLYELADREPGFQNTCAGPRVISEWECEFVLPDVIEHLAICSGEEFFQVGCCGCDCNLLARLVPHRESAIH